MENKSYLFLHAEDDVVLPDGRVTSIDKGKLSRMKSEMADKMLDGTVPLQSEYIPLILGKTLSGQADLNGLEIKTLFDMMNDVRKRRYEMTDADAMKYRRDAELRASWLPPRHSGFTPVVDFLEDNNWLTDQHIYELKVFVLGYTENEICEYAYYSLERFWHVLLHDVALHGWVERDKENEEFQRMERYYEIRAKFENELKGIDPNDPRAYAKGALKSPSDTVVNDFRNSRIANYHCDWASAMLKHWLSRRSFAEYMMCMFSKYIFTFPLGDMEQTARDFIANYKDDAFAERTLDIVDEWIHNVLATNPVEQDGKFGCVNLIRMLCIACLDDSATGIGQMTWRQAMALQYCKERGIDSCSCWEFRELGANGIERFRKVPNPFAGH